MFSLERSAKDQTYYFVEIIILIAIVLKVKVENIKCITYLKFG
jgi:hypothetical protein